MPRQSLEVQKESEKRKLNRLASKSDVEHMSYRAAAIGEHLTSRGYLEYIDQRLGFSRGTIYDLCLAAIKSKTKSKLGVKVTYRGETERQIRTTTRHYVQVRKAIFLIEFKMTKAGKQIDRVVQVHLEIQRIPPILRLDTAET